MVDKVAKLEAVATGADADADAEAPSPFAGLDKPLVVFVADTTIAMPEFDKLADVVFKNEKVGLAMKGFLAVRISPDDADLDPILEGRGKTIPRMVIVDPIKERVKVLEAKKIKVSSLYKAMQSVAKSFWKENLDKTVKKHIKFLNERDKFQGEENTLVEKERRLADDDSRKAKKDLEEIKAELAELRKEIEELEKEWSELWKLTPKHTAS